MDVHARDVVEKLKKEGVSSAEEFSWTSQMRCCPDDAELALGGIVGQICTGQFSTMLVPKCPSSYLGANCLFAFFVPNCLFAFFVPNCLFAFFVPNCPVPNCLIAKLSIFLS